MIKILSTSLVGLLPMSTLVAQIDESAQPAAPSPIVTIITCLICLAICVVILAGYWKVFTKAGQPGWAIFIPIYNIYVMCKIAGRPGWWVLIVPLVIPAIIVCIDIAKNFGKSVGFGLGLAFLSLIFFPILGFGSAQYQDGPPSIPS
jgi:hypothetical protein